MVRSEGSLEDALEDNEGSRNNLQNPCCKHVNKGSIGVDGVRSGVRYSH